MGRVERLERQKPRAWRSIDEWGASKMCCRNKGASMDDVKDNNIGVWNRDVSASLNILMMFGWHTIQGLVGRQPHLIKTTR